MQRAHLTLLAVLATAASAVATPTAAAVVSSRSDSVDAPFAFTGAQGGKTSWVTLADGNYVISLVASGTTTGWGAASVKLMEYLQTGIFLREVINYRKDDTGTWSFSKSQNFTVTGGASKVFMWTTTLYAQPGHTEYTSTIETAAPTPVPGPLAGAGMPAVLGMMGFAAWRRRRAA